MGSKREKKRKSKKSKRKKSSSSESTSQSSSSDSGDDRKRQKSEKLAQKVVAHLQKSSGKGPDQPFVWGKKVEKELAEGKKLKDISVFSDRNRLQERLEELEKVRKRQADRELEKARREEELGMVQRMRAAQEAMDSEAKEEEFYLQSLLSKAERRLREGRPAPSDLIARNLHAGLRLGEPADVDMKAGLQLDDVETLHDDIREYAEYDKHEPMHMDFWKALLAVADHELLEARKRDAVDRAHLAGGADAAARLAAASADGEKGLHPDVEADIQVMLQGQTYNELCSLEASLQASLASGEGDPEYWHAVLQRLQLHKAKAHVRDIQSRIVSATLQRLAQEAAEAAEELGLSASPDDSQGSYDGSSEDDDDDDDNDDDKEEVEGGGAGGKRQQSSGAAKVRPAGILGTAVGRAMGWAREDRQVVRAPELADAEPAAAAEEAAGLANPEEIELDYGEGSEDGDKARAGEQAQAQATTGEAGLSGDADAGPSGVATADEKKSKKKSKKSRRPRDAARDTAGAGQEGDGEGDDAAGALGPSMVGPQPANVVFPSEVPGFGRRRRRPRKGADNEAEDLARRVGGEVEEAEEAVADGTRSPEPVDPLSIVGQEVVHEEDDYRELELLRQSVKLQTSARFRAARSRGGHHSSTQDRNVRSLMRDSGRVGVHPMMRNIAAVESEGGFRAGIPAGSSAEDEALLASFRQASVKLMGNDGGDRDYGGEVPLEAQVYWWHDKYKPRRPKYFNRVHTGYEWSKYNQTHYDYDNPPPKVVQGYKFNILYHDLIDRSQTPQYVLERDPQSTDNSTCIIRFVAGPPYEDIAFRIVNKEWNYARKHGFRCSFERGILHVFFNFKRARYRR